MVSRHCGRFYLDGALVSAVVRSHWQGPSKISHLQGLEPASSYPRTAMNLAIDHDRLLSEIEALATFSDAEAPAVTRIVFTPTDLKARAWLKKRCESAALSVR